MTNKSENINTEHNSPFRGLGGITHTILMIKPIAFGYNPQTSVNNYFQSAEDKDNSDIQQKALCEFNEMVNKLRENDVDVIVEKDTLYPHTPDSIFPNNWISFHANNLAVLYPMYAENRRMERRIDVLLSVENHLNKKYRIIDYTPFEDDGHFLEGTGSIVLDRANNKAYASISERTDKALFLYYCAQMKLRPVMFEATQEIENQRLSIYHTNVMMCIADEYSVICLESIADIDERKKVISELEENSKEIVEISAEQMNNFAGNMLQIKNRAGDKLLAMSQSAFESLNAEQKQYLELQNKLIIFAIPTIEKNGGGSVRCMMAEVF